MKNNEIPKVAKGLLLCFTSIIESGLNIKKKSPTATDSQGKIYRESINMKIAAAYIRVSTEDQVEYSPDSQLKIIKEYAQRNDYILPEEYIYIDEGISAKTTKKRAEFLRMIATAKTKPKPFDAILLWKFSRFARNREDSIVYKSMLRKQLGIDVISISENIGDDKMSVLIEAMIEAMDEYYSINLAEEVRRGMTEKARRGEPLSIPPFGYTIKNKELVILPDESKIIKDVFDWYMQGDGFLKIAKRLNALGVRTHRGGKIENRTVEYWLNNPVYMGKIRWTPTGKTRREYHNPDSMIVEGHHEAIISADLWEEVQKKLIKNKEIHRKYYKAPTSISHWTVGLLQCGLCNCSMVNHSGFLTCNNKSKGTCTGCGSISVNKFGNMLISEFEEIINEKSTIEVEIYQGRKNTTSDIQILDSQLKRSYEKLKRIKEAYENGIDTLEEYGQNKLKINSEIAEISTKIKELSEKELPYEEAFKILQNNIRKSIDDLKNPEIDNVQKNKIIREYIKEMVKTRDSLSIIYRI